MAPPPVERGKRSGPIRILSGRLKGMIDKSLIFIIPLGNMARANLEGYLNGATPSFPVGQLHHLPYRALITTLRAETTIGDDVDFRGLHHGPRAMLIQQLQQ